MAAEPVPSIAVAAQMMVTARQHTTDTVTSAASSRLPVRPMT